MKKILGLDLGTNSIGWAVVEIDHLNKVVKIIALGSRILPMDAGEINTFESGGKLKSLASQRTDSRGIRRQNERFLLRRDRLHCVLNLLEMLPEHYKLSIEFENDKGKRSGKFKDGADVKFAYAYNENGDVEFLFKDAYFEMVSEFREKHPDLFYQKKNKKETKIPYDWTLYYLRKKALTQQVNKEELAWITLSFLQKRGYEKLLGQDEKEQKQNELSEIKTCRASNVTLLGICENGLKKYKVELKDELGNDVFSYIEESNSQITSVNDLKQLEITSELNEDFEIKKTTYTISEIRTLTVVDVKHALDVKNAYKKIKDNFCFDITLSTGWCFEKQSKTLPKWIGNLRDFIVKSSYDTKGKLQKRVINAPDVNDWSILKLKVETTLQEYNARHKTKGVGSYIYDSLLENPTQKLKGNRGLINTIERCFYKEELDAILSKQKEFEIHSALKDIDRYQSALTLLYPHNENHIKTLQHSDFQKLICDDVIFYQRDLKTKKSLIADCPYETENYERIDKNGNKYKQPLKAIHKSNPYYQEFRLWQFIKRLKITRLEVKQNDNLFLNQEVTNDILTLDKKESLFEFLNNRKEITQSVLLKHLKLNANDYKWNFEADHKEPCNETRYEFILRLKRIKDFPWKDFLSSTDKNGNTNEYLLWHLFYSVKKKDDLLKALNNSLVDKLLTNAGLEIEKWHSDVVKNLSSFCGYKNDYGSYSEKAIKKLLPFMRVGKYWNKDIVEQILAKSNVEIKEEVFEKEKINGEIEDFQGLWVSSACYIVYGRYSEVGDVEYWRQPSDIINYLQNDFKQHSLRNPIVEKVLRETLLVVHDIWTTYGTCKTELIDGKENKVYDKFFDEIHLEIGTDLKNNTKEKGRKTQENKENRIANERIVEILKELKQEYGEKYINVNSPFQQKKLQILEKDLLDSISKDKDTKIYTDEKGTLKITKKEISEISRKEVSKISVSDIKRYRLWLDQRYISPYTGIPIKLSDLFDREKYEIEHIFPRERITLNAMCNLVIAEVEVNKAKSNKTAYDFILTGGKNGKRSFRCAAHGNKEIPILTKEDYESKVKSFFADKAKQEILLSREIPDKFTNSQLNNSRYIAKMAMKLLSNIVREDDEKTFRSKHLLPISGGVTNILKKDWQLDEAWNELISPRFKRLNEITDTELFGSIRNVKGHDVFCPDVPEFMRSDFNKNKKRIDHRHHALDALIIALATENHVNYINNIHSSDSQQDKLASRIDIKNKYMFSQKNEDGEKDRRFLPPAQYKQNKHDGGELIAYRYVYKDREENSIFKYAVLDALQDIVVTFKQKNRIIRRRTNKFKSWNEEKNEFAFKSEKDLNNTQKYNVRQELHKATLYGRLKEQMSLSNALENVDSIVDNKLREQIVALKQMGYDNARIKQELGCKYSNVLVYKNEVSTQWHNEIETFANISKDKIIDVLENDVYDNSVRRILKNHLYSYNSMTVSIAEAGKCLDNIVYDDQKQEIIKLLKEGVNLNTILTINIGEKKYKEIEVFVRDRQVSENEEIIYNPQLAFSPNGVELMNSTIQSLNGDKLHKPIYQVKLRQALGKMYPVSENRDSEKYKRYVVAEAGSNAFCGVYQSKEGERKFVIPSLKENIENLKQGNSPCPEHIFDKGGEYHLVFILSPNDLVYVPTIEELNSSVAISYIDKERIYKFRDASINNKGVVQVNFAPYRYAKLIWQNDKGIVYGEDGSQKLKGEITITTDKDKSQNAINENVVGVQIRSCCWKLVVDRLGNIERIIKG